jgi:hypothetical protein
VTVGFHVCDHSFDSERRRSSRLMTHYPLKLRIPTKLGFKNPKWVYGDIRDQPLSRQTNFIVSAL